MISAKDMFFKYEDKFVLKNINIDIEEGSITAIIGANGSGKTTLVKHFNSLLLPSKGSVTIDGMDTKKNEMEVRKKVGFVFQNFEDQLVYSIVQDDVAFGLENMQLDRSMIKSIVEETLDKLKIRHIAESNVNMLSFGQKQLVAIAGVIAMKPKYIVFDEPTTNLDVNNRKRFFNLVGELNTRENMTIVYVTNIIDDLKYASHLVVLKNGETIFAGKKTSMRNSDLKKAGLHE